LFIEILDHVSLIWFVIPCRIVIAAHIASTASVIGIVNAQYTQNLLVTTVSIVHCREGMANRAARNVPGRNTIVMTAIVFMAELSSLALAAMAIFVVASFWLMRLKS
jgi:hypothetical protein